MTAATRTWLEAAPGGQLALVATIEGIKYPLAMASGGVLTALRTAYQADGYADVLPGLHLLGKVSQSIQPFEPVASSSSVELTFTDDGTVAALLYCPRSGASTTLEGQHGSTGATVAVADTTDFASSGDAHIGRECVQYTSKTGAPDETLNDCTRGAYFDGRTSSDARIGRPHRYQAENDLAGAGISPAVASVPRVIPNRIVSVYGHHVVDGAPSAIADRAVLFRGFLREVRRSPSGELRFLVEPMQRVLDQQILAEQFEAELSARFVVSADAPQQVRVKVLVASTLATAYERNTTIPAGTYNGWEDLREALDTALAGFTITETGYEGHRWSAAYGYAERRVVVYLADTAGAALTDVIAYVYIPDVIAGALGFEHDAFTGLDVLVSDNLRSLTAVDAPTSWVGWLGGGTGEGLLDVNPLRGTWVDQPRTVPGAPADVDGFLSLEGTIIAVNGRSADVFTVAGVLDSTRGWLTGAEIPDDIAHLRGRASDNPPKVRQVWYEQSELGDWLLRTLASFDGGGDNHATYDDRAASMGAQVPWSFLDGDSFASAGTQVLIQVEKPQSIRTVVEKLLAACGRYLLAVDGQLRLAGLPWESPFGVARAITTDDYSGDAYPEQTLGGQPIVNRVRLKTGIPPLVPAGDMSVQELGSMSDHGPAPGPSFDAPGLVDINDWATRVVGPALAYLSRDPQEIAIPAGWPLATLAPADGVTITDASILDPTTGARGVTALPAVVLGTDFDFATGGGQVRVLCLPGAATRSCIWAPAARVTGYSVGGYALNVAANTYGLSAEGEDLDEFSVGDAILIHTIDASGSPVSEAHTIASIDRGSRDIGLDSNFSVWDDGRVWDVTVPINDDCVARQLARFGFHSDGTSTGHATAAYDAPNTYATEQDGTTAAAFGDVGYPDMSSLEDGKGGPAAVSSYALAARTLDRIARYRGRQILVGDSYVTPVSSLAGTTLTDWHLHHWTIPIEYPSALESWRTFEAAIAAKADTGGATWLVRVMFAKSLPSGPGYNVGEWGSLGAGVACADMTVNSTSYAVHTASVAPPAYDDRRWYVLVLAKRTAGAGSLDLRDISVVGY